MIVDLRRGCLGRGAMVRRTRTPKAVTIAENPNRLIAPDLIFPEVGNVLRRKVRSGLIAASQAMISIQNLGRAFTRIIPSQALIDDAFAMASRLDHSVTMSSIWPAH